MSDPGSDPAILTHAQLITLACLIHSGDIPVGQYIGWAEKTLLEQANQPYWVVQLVGEFDTRKAAAILLQEAGYGMDGRWHVLDWGGLQIALLFLRYRTNSTAWSDFLTGAIRIATSKASPLPVSDYQRLLDAFGEYDESPAISHNQAAHIEQILQEEILELKTLASSFPLPC